LKQKQILIQNIQDLTEKLGDSFILMVGSAVPGVNSPHLPMVLEVLEKIFENIYIRLENGTFEETIVAEHAKSLCKKGKYNYLLESTKFEEFLGILQLILGRDKLDELLRILYLCCPNEYGLNQSSISWLLENRKCIICLTTNFDNSLENASDIIETYTYIDYPNIINKITNIPIQLKLHGSVNDNSCVATIRSIFEHTSIKTYNFLIELLKDKKVLVLGYSGDGDVDINPNLLVSKENGSEFFWCKDKVNKPVPKYSKYKVICDLRSDDPKKNLLLGLASHYGWECTLKKRNHKWKNGLKDWCDSISPEKLARILIQILIKKPGWQVIHVMTFYPYTIDTENIEINRGIACLQKSAYGIAERIFTEVINNKNLDQSELITSKLYLGFVQWRKGKYKRALETLWWFYNIDYVNYKEKQKFQISYGYRIYLEVIRDWMQLQLFKYKRRKIYEKYRVYDVIKKYKALESYDFRDNILKQVVLIHIDYLKDGKNDKKIISEISKMFDLSCNTKNWDVAEAIGRLFVGVRFRKGLLALVKVDYELIKRKQWNLLRKSIAAILNKMTLGIMPWLTIGLFDSPILYNIASIYRNYQYQYKTSNWKKQRNKKRRKKVTVKSYLR
jgi:hypothetical protein